MDKWQSHGDILRWWRNDVAELSQQQLADRLSVGRTAVSNWEKGTRLASVDIKRIDDALDAEGVLAGLLWALGSPEGIEPNRIWTTVYPDGASAVWLWLRHPDDAVWIEGEWGIYAIEGEVKLGANGLLITLGASIPESPLVIQLSTPGWVDFGSGRPPEDIEDLPVVNAMEMMKPSSANGDFANLLSATIVERFENEPPHEIAQLPQESMSSMETFLHNVDQPGAGPPPGSWPELREGIDHIDRSRFSRMRQARRLSLADVKHRLADQTGIRVGKDTLRRFEAGKGQPHEPLLPIALDHVLGGNGRLVLAELASGSGSGSVTIPDFWQAPVWLAFDGEPGEFVAELQWGGWRRRIDDRLPSLVICHSAMAPLRIIADRAVRWTVGVGRRNGATPINHGWIPSSVDTSNEALSTYQEALMKAVRERNERRRKR